MEAIESCAIPMVFSTVDRVFRISFHIVRDLPYASAPSASERRRVLAPHPNQLGCLSPRIPPTRQRHRRTSPLLGLFSVPFDQQLTMTRASRVLDTPFPNGVGTCKSAASNLWPARESSTPTQTETDDPTIMDGAVWEDEGTVDWVLRLSNAVSSLPRGTSVQVDAGVKGPQRQSWLLVIIESREKLNLKRGVDIRVPRGIQWWEPGNPLKCKVTNVVTTPISISKGVPVATVYDVNNFDIPHI